MRHCRTSASAHAASLSAWQPLQAFGDWYAMVAAGAGGAIEWSLRFMRANAVFGMWQEMHLLPSPSARWCVCAAGAFTLSSWQGTQALLNFSFLNR